MRPGATRPGRPSLRRTGEGVRLCTRPVIPEVVPAIVLRNGGGWGDPTRGVVCRGQAGRVCTPVTVITGSTSGPKDGSAIPLTLTGLGVGLGFPTCAGVRGPGRPRPTLSVACTRATSSGVAAAGVGPSTCRLRVTLDSGPGTVSGPPTTSSHLVGVSTLGPSLGCP